MEKKFSASKANEFSGLLESFGKTQLGAVLDAKSSGLAAGDSKIYSKGDILNKTLNEPLLWFVPDSMGMCVQTGAKFRMSSNSVVKCTQRVTSGMTGETDKYQSTMFSNPARTSTIALNSKQTTSGDGSLSLTEYVRSVKEPS